MDQERSPRATTRMIIGVALLILGGILLLGNFEVLDVGPVWRAWPLIIVALGISKMAQAGDSHELQGGFWMILIGLWLFVSIAHIFGLTFGDSWPILLIGLGISMVWKALLPEKYCGCVKD